MARNPYNAANRLLFCTIKLSPTLSVRYAFLTNISGTSATVLGLESATTEEGGRVLKAGMTIGVNAPKPHRASKETSGQGSETSYISDSKIPGAIADGWTIKSPKFRSPPRSNSQVLVYVETRVGGTTVPFGWPMPKYQLDAITEAGLAKLGITIIGNTEVPVEKALFGVNAPRPGRAKKKYQELPGSNGEGSGVVSTFYSDNASETALADKWILSQKAQLIDGYIIP